MILSQFYLEEVDALLEMEQSSFELGFFESGDDSTPDQSFIHRAIESTKKAIKSLIEAIQGIIEKFTDFVKYLFMSPEDKARFNELRKMVREDPELAGIKVSIRMWKEYEKAYEEALKKAEAESKGSRSSEVLDTIIGAVEDEIAALGPMIQEVGARGVTSVTLQMAVDLADQNVIVAKGIKAALDAEVVELKNIEDSLGADKAEKFRKDIETAARNTWFHRAKVRIFKHKTNTFSKLCKHYGNKLLSFTNYKKGGVPDGRALVDGGSIIRGIAKNHKTVVDAVGGADGVMKTAAVAANAAISAKTLEHDAKKTIKQVKKSIKQTQNYFK